MNSEQGLPEGLAPIKKKSGLKRLLKALFWTLGVLLVLALIPFILLFIYEKEIKGAIVTEINNHLKTKV